MEYRVPDLRLHAPTATQNCGNFDQWPELRNQQIQSNVHSTLPAHRQPAYSRGHNALLLPNQNSVRNAFPGYTQPDGHNSLPMNTHLDGRNTIPLQRQTNGKNALSDDTHVNVNNALPLQRQNNGQNALSVDTLGNVNNTFPLQRQTNGHDTLSVDTHITGQKALPMQAQNNSHNALSVDTQINGHNALPIQRQNNGHNALSLQRQNNGHSALPLQAQNSTQTTSHILQQPCYGTSGGFTRQSCDNQGSNLVNLNRQQQIQQAFTLSKDGQGLLIDCAPNRVPALLNYLSDNNMTFDQLFKTLKSGTFSAGADHNVSASAHKGSVNGFQTAITFGQTGTTSTDVRRHGAVAWRPRPGIHAQQPRTPAGTRMGMNQMLPSSIQKVQNTNQVSIPHPHQLRNIIHGMNQDIPMIHASNPMINDGPNPNQITRTVNNLHNSNQYSLSQNPQSHNYRSGMPKAPQTVKTTMCVNPTQGLRPHSQAYSNLSSTSLSAPRQSQCHVRAPSLATNVPTDINLWENVNQVINDALSKKTSQQMVRQGNISAKYPVMASSRLNSEVAKPQTVSISTRSSAQASGLHLNRSIPSCPTTAALLDRNSHTVHTTRSPPVSGVSESRHERVIVGATTSMTTTSRTTPGTNATLSGTQNIRPLTQTRETRTVTIDINGVRHVLELPSIEPVSHVNKISQCETPQNEASLAPNEQLAPERTSNLSCSPTGVGADGVSVPDNDNTRQQEKVVTMLKKKHVHSGTANTLPLPASRYKEGIDIEYNRDSRVDTVTNINKDVSDYVAQLNATGPHDSVKSYCHTPVHVITPDTVPSNRELKSMTVNATVGYIDKNRDADMSENHGGSGQLSGQEVKESNESENLSGPEHIHVIRPEMLPSSAQQTAVYPELNSSDKKSCSRSKSSSGQGQKVTESKESESSTDPELLHFIEPEMLISNSQHTSGDTKMNSSEIESWSRSMISSGQGQTKPEIASQENPCPLSNPKPRVSTSGSSHDRNTQPCGNNVPPGCSDSKTEIAGRDEFSSSHQSYVLSVPSSSPLHFSRGPGSAQSNNGDISDSVTDKNEIAQSGDNAVSEELSDSQLKTNRSPRLVPKGSSNTSSKEKGIHFTGDPNRQVKPLATKRKQDIEMADVCLESAEKGDERGAANSGDSEEVLTGTGSVPKDKITVTVNGCVQKPQHTSVTGYCTQMEHLENAVEDISAPDEAFESCYESGNIMVYKNSVPKNTPNPVDHAVTNQSLFKEASQMNENASRPVQKVAPFCFKENEKDCFSGGALKSKYDDTTVAVDESQGKEESDSLIGNCDDCSTEGYSSSGYEGTFSDEDVSTTSNSRNYSIAGLCFKGSCENPKEGFTKLRIVRVSRDRRNLKRLQCESIDDGTTPIAELTHRGVGRARHKGKRKLSNTEVEVRKTKFRRIRVISESVSDSDEEEFRHVAKFQRVTFGRRPHGLEGLSCENDDEYSTEMPKLRKVRVNRVRSNMNRNVFTDIVKNDIRTNKSDSDGNHSPNISKREDIRTPKDKKRSCIMSDMKNLKPLRVVLERVDTKGKFRVSLNEKKQKIGLSEDSPRSVVFDRKDTKRKLSASLNKRKQKFGSCENRPGQLSVRQNETLFMNSDIKSSLIASSSKSCQPLRENITQLERSSSEYPVTTLSHVVTEESCTVVAQSPYSRQSLKENAKQVQSSSPVSPITRTIDNSPDKSEGVSAATAGGWSAPNRNRPVEQKKCSLVDSLVHGLNEKKDQLRLLYKPVIDDVIVLDD